MSPSISAPGAGSSASDATPLLISSDESFLRRGVNSIGRRSALTVARMFHRVGSRRVLREPSMRVREAAAEQIGELHSDWAYSRPVAVFGLVLKTILVVTSIVVLVLSRDETTSLPLRAWIIVFDIEQVVEMLCYWVEYFRRHNFQRLNSNAIAITRFVSGFPLYGSVAKHVGSATSLFTFIWWIMGTYWVLSGGSTLAEDAPELYWTCIVFLSLDFVYLAIFVLLACLVGIALCFCLPFITTILHVVADQEGATTEDIQQLPMFIYKATVDSEKYHGEIVESRGGMIIEGISLPVDNAVCDVCLSEYEDRSKLRQLPCSHLFHSMCIDKWLRIKPTCPLCNVSILKSREQISHVQA